MKYEVSLDVGTTGARALVFDEEEKIVASEYRTLTRHTAGGGIVEQDPKEFIDVSTELLRAVASKINKEEIHSLGIATQRETTIMWERETGKALCPAIVWQDERTKEWCEKMKDRNELVLEKTGLPITPYFSASKIAWILENVPGARKDGILFGTLDSWLLFNLSAERAHLSDYTNASRTLLFNIYTRSWDEELLELFDVPSGILPHVLPSRARFGTLKEDILGREISIEVLAGDQQASLFAAGTSVGTTKITYGTGIFVLQVVEKGTRIPEGFFKTLTCDSPKPQYALEAKVGHAAERITPVLDDPSRLRLVMEDIAKETAPYVELLPIKPSLLIADGGGSQNDFLLKRQSELTGLAVERLSTHNGTALGIAKLLL